jgi:membrane fusion protein, multidrug efflux system
MRNALTNICLIALVIVSCSRNKQGTSTAGAFGGGPTPAREYAVLTLSPKSVTVHQDFPATIQGQRVIEIRPMINGYLQEIYVNEGDQVKRGQLLFRINNPIYEQQVITAKARINSAQADVNSAEIEIDKIKPLVEKEIVSNYRLKSAELILKAKEAALEQTKAELSNAQTNLSYTIIKSPQDGIIGTIPYKNGALVSSTSPEALTNLSDIQNVFAYFSWNEKQLLNMLAATPGLTLEEKVKSMPPATLILANLNEYPEKGKIEIASGLISTETGSATFKAIFPNMNGLIRSGSSATVRVPEIIDSVFVVPQGATYELQNKRFIYKVGADNKVTAVAFISVASDNGQYFYVSKGLISGDRVVLEGVSSLREGMEIKPREADEVKYYSQIK